MGDMLVKQGKPEIARNVYENAKISRSYRGWSYKHILEERITQADENVAKFRADAKAPAIMIKSAFSCAACHQD